MWYIYLLVSQSLKYLNHTYVGITTNLDRRLKQHNGLIQGGAKNTRAKRPYNIAYYISDIENRSIAQKLEYDIKKQKGYENRLAYIKKLNY